MLFISQTATWRTTLESGTKIGCASRRTRPFQICFQLALTQKIFSTAENRFEWTGKKDNGEKGLFYYFWSNNMTWCSVSLWSCTSKGISNLKLSSRYVPIVVATALIFFGKSSSPVLKYKNTVPFCLVHCIRSNVDVIIQIKFFYDSP